MRPEAKVSGRRNRASEESKTQESQEEPQTCDQATTTPEKVKDNRHRKRMTNHEGQPRPPSQPTNAWDTAGQKHTHPKVREGQQGDRTVNPSRHHRNWSTLTQKKKGTAEAQPTSPGKQKDRHPVTGKPQGNLQLGKLRKLQAQRKSTAHGRKPSDAANTPPTQPQGITAGVDQQTGARKIAAPAKGAEPRWEEEVS